MRSRQFVATLGLAGALALACGVATGVAAQSAPEAAGAGPWEVVFDVSAGGIAKREFLRGMVNMHLFMYPDAADAFRAAQAADPDFAMAYWGEALTHYQPIWRQFDRDAGRAVMHRLGATAAERIAKARTPREKAYISTLDVLFGDGERPLRAYADAMESLVARYPDDDEALAMWAVSRVVQFERTDEDMQERIRTASIAQELLRRRPRHPGAPRYLIQSVDDPIHADLGKLAAQIYVDARPDSPEARHVPTHIAAQLGYWRQMADLNREAFELSMTWTARHGYKLQDLNNHDYGHLLTYEQYGYLQLGQYSRARQVIDRVRNDYVASGSAPEIASTLANTLAQFVVETGDQDALRELRQIAAQSNAPAPAVTYAIALASATLGDLSPAHQELARLNAKVPAAMLMRDELQALVDSALGNDTGALRALERAAKTDWAQVYTHFGPPVPFKPPHELYGEALLKLRRATDALSVFQQELQIYRGRTAALAGAARAAAAAGDAHLAASYARQVKANLADADRSLTAFDDVLTLARSDPRP